MQGFDPWSIGGVWEGVATNLRDNAPFAAVHRDGLTKEKRSQWDQAYRLGIELADRGKPDEARDAFLGVVGIDDRHAELHFRLACVLLASRQLDEAYDHFAQARDLDALRFRADSRINEIIRDVAGRETCSGIYLVDAERAFRATDAAEHGIPGRELFYEHVHMTTGPIEGRPTAGREYSTPVIVVRARQTVPSTIEKEAGDTRQP